MKYTCTTLYIHVQRERRDEITRGERERRDEITRGERERRDERIERFRSDSPS